MLAGDDEEDTSMDFGGGTALGGLFSADKAALASGNDTFKWKPPVKEKKKKAAPVDDTPQEPDVLAPAMVKLFNQTTQATIGIARCNVKLSSPDAASVIFTNNEKKLLLEIPLTSTTYWTQTPYDGQQQYVSAQVLDSNGYAIVYSLQFKRPDEATAFTLSVYLVQYSLSLREGSPRKIFELLGGEGEQLDHGDMVGLKYKYFQTTTANNKFGFLEKVHAYDESKEGDAKKVRIGDGKIMKGIDTTLREMTKGQRRFVILTPDETLDGSGGRHPVLNDETIVGCYVDVSKVKRAKSENSPTSQSSALVVAEAQPAAAAPPVVAAEPVPVQQPEPVVQQPQPTPTPAPAPVAAAAAAPNLDTNTLLTTLLVNQLQGGAKPAAPTTPTPSSENSEILRGVDRLMVQMGQLYQKMDHIDITRKLEENNEKVEVMFRRVMGKAPTAGFDAAAAGIKGEADTATLWAEIEKRDKKIDDLTESYHNALASISNNKDETTSLRNDLQIERDTAIERLKEANERHRLIVLDYDVKARTEKEHAVEAALKQGKEEGYKLGFAEGEREAFLKHAGGEPSDVLNQLEAARAENTELQSEMIQMQVKLQEERKSHDEQIQMMNLLINKYEERSNEEPSAVAGSLKKDDVVLLLSRSLKSIMNSVYYKIQEELTGQDPEVTATFLTSVTKIIKSSTKSAIATVKQQLDETVAMAEGAAASSEPPPPPPPPPPPVE